MELFIWDGWIQLSCIKLGLINCDSEAPFRTWILFLDIMFIVEMMSWRFTMRHLIQQITARWWCSVVGVNVQHIGYRHTVLNRFIPLVLYTSDYCLLPIDNTSMYVGHLDHISTVYSLMEHVTWKSPTRTAAAHMLERQAGSLVWGSRNTRKKWTRPEPPGQGRAV